MKQDAFRWWRSLSINEMKAFEKKHFPIVFQFNGKTIRTANRATLSDILYIYKAEYGLTSSLE
jgi:hypothetical protein